MTIMEFSATGPSARATRTKQQPMSTPGELIARDGVLGVLVVLDDDGGVAVEARDESVRERMWNAFRFAFGLERLTLIHTPGSGWTTRVERCDEYRATVVVVAQSDAPVHKSIARTMRRVARNVRAEKGSHA